MRPFFNSDFLPSFSICAAIRQAYQSKGKGSRSGWTAALLALAMLAGSAGCSLWRSPPAPRPPSPEPTAATVKAKKSSKEASQQLDLAIHLETAELARQRGMDDEAIEQYLAARRIDPQVGEVAHPLAVLYDRAGKADAAEREYRRALEEQPHDADVLCDYGYFLYSRGRIEPAEEMLRGALEQRPGHQQAAINLALVLGSRGQYDESFRLFHSAIGPAAAHHNVGMLKLRSGDRAGAIQDLRTAAKNDPSLGQTREVLAQLE